MMRVLIGGITGFIGQAIGKRLARDGFEVLGLSRREISDPEFEIFHYDYLKTLDKDVIGSVDAIINCAGLAHQRPDPGKSAYWQANVGLVEKLGVFALESEVKRFIHISSVSVYGNRGSAKHLTESDYCNPIGSYAKSKLEGEQRLLSILGNSAVETIILRPSTVIGEKDPGNVLRLIKLLDKGIFVQVGSGKNQKSFIYIEDLAYAVEKLLFSEVSGPEVFNVTDKHLAVNEIVILLAQALECRILPVSFPATPVKGAVRAISRLDPTGRFEGVNAQLEKWLSDDVFSGAKLSGIFTPEIGVAEGLEREVNWYRNLSG